MERLRRCPLTWAMLAFLPLVVFPQIDLGISGLFYRPEDGFFLHDFWLFRFILKGLPPLVMTVTLAVVVLGLAGDWLRGRFPKLPRVRREVALFLAVSLALGPGLVVNWLLKDHWGRARPSQIIEFGGTAHFTPPLMMADQCVSNCSFSSGHGAFGFWLIAFALLAPQRWRTAAVAAAVGFGCLVGFSRIAQGGHFFSDTVFSGVVVVAMTVGLWKRMVRGEN
jgi:lipid A 4'-phosphatase